MSPEWLQMMARYNAWQNHTIVDCADGLSTEQRQADRGAFFKSVLGTLSHALWGDLSWMGFFDGGPSSDCAISKSGTRYADWEDFKSRRKSMDRRIMDWAGGLSPADVTSDLEWRWSPDGPETQAPKLLVFSNLFTHSIQHRGQVHALLTGFGKNPGNTDLYFMPKDGPWL
jgi:uncharacterized damage-inducible protein DinB